MDSAEEKRCLLPLLCAYFTYYYKDHGIPNIHLVGGKKVTQTLEFHGRTES